VTFGEFLRSNLKVKHLREARKRIKVQQSREAQKIFGLNTFKQNTKREKQKENYNQT
jgi:hypothetical protein